MDNQERIAQLHPNVKNQLALVRRDLKSQSKNDVVRAVLGLLVEIAKKDTDLKRKDNLIEALKKEAALADEFLKSYESEFESFLEENAKREAEAKQAEATQLVQPTPSDAIPDETA